MTGTAAAGRPHLPPDVRFCSRCGAPLQLRPVAGRLRPACEKCDFAHFADPKVGVGVQLVRTGRLLLVQRRMQPGRGRWSLPGGYLDAGDDPRVTAAREVLEETGLRIGVGRIVDVYYNGPGPGASVFLLYEGLDRGGEPCAGDDAAAAAFFPPTDLPPLAFASTEEAVRGLQAH